MKKFRFLSMLLVLVLTVGSLAACGGDTKKGVGDSNDSKHPLDVEKGDNKGGVIESEGEDNSLNIDEPEEEEYDELSGADFADVVANLDAVTKGESYIVMDFTYTYRDMFEGEDIDEADTDGFNLDDVAISLKATMTTQFDEDTAHSTGVMSMNTPFLLQMLGLTLEDFYGEGYTDEDLLTVIPMEGWFQKLSDNTWASWQLGEDGETWEYDEVDGGVLFGFDDYSAFYAMEEVSPGNWRGKISSESINDLMASIDANEEEIPTEYADVEFDVELTIHNNRVTDISVDMGGIGLMTIYYDYDIDIDLELPIELIAR